MTNVKVTTKPEIRSSGGRCFGFRISDFFRHYSFDIRHLKGTYGILEANLVSVSRLVQHDGPQPADDTRGRPPAGAGGTGPGDVFGRRPVTGSLTHGQSFSCGGAQKR